MSLISCPECQNQVSDTASACPKCGAPISKSANSVTASKRTSAGRKVLIGVGVIVAVPIIAAVVSGGSSSSSSPSAAGSGSGTVSAVPGAKWQYSEDKDAMGTITHSAELESENTIDQQPPYSTTHGYLTIRSSRKGGANILFHIDNGQILCHGFMNETLRMKVDNRGIEKIRCATPSDGDSKYTFIESEKHVLSELLGSKKVVIQPTVYQAGDPQFVFSTDGLKWTR